MVLANHFWEMLAAVNRGEETLEQAEQVFLQSQIKEGVVNWRYRFNEPNRQQCGLLAANVAVRRNFKGPNAG